MRLTASDYRAAVDAVTAILENRDPLELSSPGFAIPPDEYAGEAAEIVRKVIAVWPSAVAEIGAVAHGVFVESFGADDARRQEDYMGVAADVKTAIEGLFAE